jgi:phosphoribosylamine--glycine ligase
VKALVIGGDGRAHAIVWKLSQSKHINKIYCCPGNAGIGEIAECIDLSPNDFSTVIDFVKYEWIDVTILGSERNFPKGLVEAFEREGCKILAPNQTAAEANASRVFAKNLLKSHRIPTTDYKVFSSYLLAQDYVRLKGAPLVIKADGHSDNNDIFFANTVDEAINILKLIMKDRMLGDAGKQVIIEEAVEGERVSFVLLADGHTIAPFSSISLHTESSKKAMGSRLLSKEAYASVSSRTEQLEVRIMDKVFKPLLRVLSSEEKKYRGVISAELVVHNEKILIYEYHCWFKEPDLQTLLPRLGTDLIDIVFAVIEGRLSDLRMEWSHETSVCIVISKKKYQSDEDTYPMITGLEQVKTLKDVVVFHENTAFRQKRIVACGEKILDITATGADISEARAKAYSASQMIRVKGLQET